MEDVEEGFLHAGCFCAAGLKCGDPCGCEGIGVAFFFRESAVDGDVGTGGEVFGTGSEAEVLDEGIEVFHLGFRDEEIRCNSHDGVVRVMSC